jgi:GTP cyclohydrolase II
MSNFEKTTAELETEYGNFQCTGYFFEESDDQNILVLAKDPFGKPTLVRVQSLCYTGEVFLSQDCDCHAQLAESLSRIQKEGGAFVYLLRDGRGAGLRPKLHALHNWRQDRVDTVETYKQLGLQPDPRSYDKVCTVLKDLGLDEIRLLTNNPRKLDALHACGFKVSHEPLQFDFPEGSDARAYLRTKAVKLGHLFK